MRNNTAKRTLIITRNCCVSGNCFICCTHGTHPRPFGESARIEHWRGTDKVRANEIVRNWAAYRARIEA